MTIDLLPSMLWRILQFPHPLILKLISIIHLFDFMLRNLILAAHYKQSRQLISKIQWFLCVQSSSVSSFWIWLISSVFLLWFWVFFRVSAFHFFVSQLSLSLPSTNSYITNSLWASLWFFNQIQRPIMIPLSLLLLSLFRWILPTHNN